VNRPHASLRHQSRSLLRQRFCRGHAQSRSLLRQRFCPGHAQSRSLLRQRFCRGHAQSRSLLRQRFCPGHAQSRSLLRHAFAEATPSLDPYCANAFAEATPPRRASASLDPYCTRAFPMRIPKLHAQVPVSILTAPALSPCALPTFTPRYQSRSLLCQRFPREPVLDSLERQSRSLLHRRFLRGPQPHTSHQQQSRSLLRPRFPRTPPRSLRTSLDPYWARTLPKAALPSPRGHPSRSLMRLRFSVRTPKLHEEAPVSILTAPTVFRSTPPCLAHRHQSRSLLRQGFPSGHRASTPRSHAVTATKPEASRRSRSSVIPETLARLGAPWRLWRRKHARP
jgi:hypothetical protein